MTGRNAQLLFYNNLAELFFVRLLCKWEDSHHWLGNLLLYELLIRS
jgi:hypothetical protein